jgi:diguanylate cyclase
MPIRLCRFVLALLLWSVLGLAAPAAAAAELVLAPDAKSMPVDREVELLVEEPGENLTREQVMQPEMAARWRVYPRKTINLPAERKPVWMRFTVRNAGQKAQWMLGIDWALLDDVHFHRYDPGARAWTAWFQGGLDHPEDIKVRKDPNPLFPLPLDAGERVTVLLRAQSHNALVAPLMLWEIKEWQARRYDYGVAMGLLFGILGVMFCYNLSLYIFTRERSFRTYSLYLLSIIAYELTVTGFGPLFIWQDNAWLNRRGYEFFAASSFLAATIFFRRFLSLGRAAPHLNRMNQGFIVLFSVLAVLAVFPTPVAVPLALALGGFVVGFVGIYTAGYLAWRGDVLARYFVIAWISVIAATFLLFLAMAGVIDGGAWIKYAQPVGFVVETILLSMALAERFKRERLSKEAAQRQSVELLRHVEEEREEKIRAQEHALAVQRKANEELELRVLDRTAELKRAMDSIELANVELARLSVTDALTKVHNRRYFDDTLRKEYDRSARTGMPIALMMADIDHFKKINDSVGHVGGDECLKLVAAALAGCVGRSTDLVARYGGEEFAVILPATGAAQAVDVAERIRRAVEDIQFVYGGQRMPVTISLGVVARVADPERPLADFVSEADQALYAAKNAGRNRVKLAQ